MSANGLVFKVLEQLASIAMDEARLVLEEEVARFTSNLRAIQAVLADAESRQQKEAKIHHWLQNLTDVSYEINDLLDKWSAMILKSQIEAEADKVASNLFSTRKVGSFVQSFCFGSKEVGLLQRHDIAFVLKQLKQKLDDIASEKNSCSIA